MPNVIVCFYVFMVFISSGGASVPASIHILIRIGEFNYSASLSFTENGNISILHKYGFIHSSIVYYNSTSGSYTAVQTAS